MNTRPNMTTYNRRQSGVALIIGLLVLLLLTLITVTAIRMTTLEERMASNLRNQSIAFQAAESALREAEGLIANNGGAPNPFKPLQITGGPFQNASDTPCVNGLCGTTAPLQSDDIYTATGLATASTGISNIADEPQYMIELMFIEPSPDSSRLYATFRITALAWGADTNAVIQLQSTFRLHAESFLY